MKTKLTIYSLKEKTETLHDFLCALTAFTVFESIKFQDDRDKKKRELWIDVKEEDVDVPPLALIATPIKSDDERSVKYSVIRFYDSMIRMQLGLPLDFPDIDDFFTSEDHLGELIKVRAKGTMVIDPSQIKKI